MDTQNPSPATETSSNHSMLEGLFIPAAYRPSVDKAMASNPVDVANYLKHTMIADPLMDRITEEFADMDRAELAKFLGAGMNEDTEAMRDAPQGLRDFFINYPPVEPPWLDYEAFVPGIRKFHKDSAMILSGFAAGVLVDGFGTLIAKSFVQTGRIFHDGVRRLRQNNRHFLEIFFPDGLKRTGDGWKLSVRIRFVHAQVRQLLYESGEWDTETQGVPISAAHCGYAAACFSARTIKHSESMGVSYTREERDSIIAIWRYTGYLMGVPEAILLTTEEDALKLHKTAALIEPPISTESIIMANALLNSAPVVAGVEDPVQRQRMVDREIYPISRALIGNELADQLKFPRPRKNIGLLFQFRTLQRLRRLWARIRRKPWEAESFGSLLAISAFDEAGISYRMPDHARSEHSSGW